MKNSDIPSEYRPLPETTPTMQQVTLNPTHPSIPSRWEKKKTRNMDDYFDGFGSRAQKLKQTPSDVPGPGFYHKNISQDESTLLRKSASLSKKGFSNAFVSKSDRLRDVTLNKNLAGPGHYAPKTVDEIFTHKCGAIFAQSGNGRVPYEDPMRDGLRAGPGQYRVDANFVPNYIRNKPTAAMRSKSKRESFLITPSKDTPAPTAYNPNIKSTLPDRHTFWSKSKWIRFRDLGVDNLVPGPGMYFDELQDEGRQNELREGNHRIVGKKYTPKGKQNENRSFAIHTFGADTDRFKHSILGRLDLAAETPGPGWYAPLDIVPLETQAQLTRKACSNPATMTAAQKQQMMSVFRMTGVQTADIKKPIQHRTPGPAYYYPKKPESKKFSQNPTGRWA